jgi:hypothetical protein
MPRMEFQGAGLPLNETGLDRVCTSLGVAAPEVWAVVTVETSGFGFLPERRPRILFERHIFHRLTDGRFDAVAPDISNAARGGYAGGSAEYRRLEAAMRCDRRAALESASWGIGQVMGFNHQVVGFDTVEEMVAAMVRDEASQLAAMASFITHTGLDAPLRRRDWTSFARGYNGRDFAANHYDTRLAAAHANFEQNFPNLGLRSVQAALLYAGFDPGPIDGVVGRRTRAALRAFQAQHGLPQTGERDGVTEARLFAEAFPAVGA